MSSSSAPSEKGLVIFLISWAMVFFVTAGVVWFVKNPDTPVIALPSIQQQIIEPTK